MQQVNAAYAAGDEDALQRILTDLDASPDAVQDSDVASDLIRVLRQLKQVRDLIAALELEIANTAENDLAKLNPYQPSCRMPSHKSIGCYCVCCICIGKNGCSWFFQSVQICS